LKLSLNTYQVVLYSYVLMQNHYHLLVETPHGNVSEFMRHFNLTYAAYYNKRHNRVGHLYQGRYKSILVDKESYLTTLSRYIHLNPIRTEQFMFGPTREKEKFLKEYPWSSLSGYIDEGKKSGLIGYALILSEYGGDSAEGRMGYWKQIRRDIVDGLEVKSKVVGQCVLGTDEFVKWVKNTFATGAANRREIPSLRGVLRYRSRDEILKVICDETDRAEREILQEKGPLRQMAMELLFRYGGLKGVEIAQMMGLDYSTVSRDRKQLREDVERDATLKKLMARVEGELSKVKI
jgi:putative transposase